MANIVFFILLTLTLSSTIHARESQFFNKFSNNIPTESQPLNTNQQQPEFIPQTQDSNSYGLYGQESSQLPPSTTTTTNNNNINNNNNNHHYNNNNKNYNNNYYDNNKNINNNYNSNNYDNKNNHLPSYLPANYNPVAYTTPIHSNTQDIPNEFNDPNAYKYNGESRMYNSEEFVGTNGGDMYNSEKQGFDDARFMETEEGGNMYNSEKQVENGRYNQGMGGTKYSTSNNANMYNSGKQGMSDTRFLENGKYYYDVNMENVNSNANMNTRGVNSRNEYNTQGYYGNNENSYDRYNYNSNGGGYEDQEDQFNP